MEKRITHLNNNGTLGDIKNSVMDYLKLHHQFDDKIDDVAKIFQSGTILYFNATEISPLWELVEPQEAVMTVLSSGDYLLDAVFQGADKVLAFDVNKRQFFPAQLKLKALQHFNYDTFYSFFSDAFSDRFLDYDSYQYLKYVSEDNPELYTFWDKFMEQVKLDRNVMQAELRMLDLPSDRKKLISALSRYGFYYIEGLSERTLNYILNHIDSAYCYDTVFSQMLGLQGIQSSNYYLANPDTYLETRERVQESDLDFISTDIRSIKKELAHCGYLDDSDYNGFKTIYLSNIPEYLRSEDFVKALDEELMPLLQRDGVIAYCCQGISPSTLTMSNDALNRIKNMLSNQNHSMEDYLKIQKIIHCVEAFRVLRTKYCIDVVQNYSLDFENGYDTGDSYVYVKRK